MYSNVLFVLQLACVLGSSSAEDSGTAQPGIAPSPPADGLQITTHATDPPTTRAPTSPPTTVEPKCCALPTATDASCRKCLDEKCGNEAHHRCEAEIREAVNNKQLTKDVTFKCDAEKRDRCKDWSKAALNAGRGDILDSIHHTVCTSDDYAKQCKEGPEAACETKFNTICSLTHSRNCSKRGFNDCKYVLDNYCIKTNEQSEESACNTFMKQVATTKVGGKAMVEFICSMNFEICTNAVEMTLVNGTIEASIVKRCEGNLNSTFCENVKKYCDAQNDKAFCKNVTKLLTSYDLNLDDCEGYPKKDFYECEAYKRFCGQSTIGPADENKDKCFTVVKKLHEERIINLAIACAKQKEKKDFEHGCAFIKTRMINEICKTNPFAKGCQEVFYLAMMIGGGSCVVIGVCFAVAALVICCVRSSFRRLRKERMDSKLPPTTAVL